MTASTPPLSMDAAMADADDRHAANGTAPPPKDVPDNANENCPGASSEDAVRQPAGKWTMTMEEMNSACR